MIKASSIYKNLRGVFAIIVKTLLLTLLRKKTRALLLLFSIAVCASLLFANWGFQKTTRQMIYNASTRWSGSADLYITPRQSAGAEEWISPDLLAPYRDELEYDFNLIHSRVLYAPSVTEMQYFTALGTDIDEFNTYNPLELQSGSVDSWTGNKVIIGTAYAQKLGLTVGDMILLEINGESHNFQISGISQPNGLFTRELDDGGYLLMPRETLANIIDEQCNLIFLKANDPSSVPALMQTLASAFPQYVIHMGINHAVIGAETNSYVLPFWISSIMVLFMSVFIIYSSFNLIVNERISILGIMRSVGCTRRKTNRILILESMIIGLVGGIIGCVLGIGVLHVIKNVYFSGESAVINAPVLFGGREVIFTVAASIIITVFSAMLPILKVTKIPIKNIILNDFQKQRLKNARLWPMGILLLLPCLLFPLLIKSKGIVGMISASIVATLALIGLNLLIPLLCRFGALLSRKFPYDIALGLRNVGDFKALINITRLFATTMAIMVFMMTIFNSLATDLRNMYERERYDITVVLQESSQETLTLLSQTDGVASYYGVYSTSADINNYNSFMNEVFGIDDSDFFNYFPAGIPRDVLKAIETLGNGRNIVTTDILREKLGLHIGDILTLQFDDGAYDFQITGFLDTNYGIGHVSFISSDNLKEVTSMQDYSRFLVRAEGNPETVKNNILRALLGDVLSIQTKQEREAANADKVEGIFNAINTYAYFAMLIGIFGIFNNMASCFLDRRRNLALYRCVGMSAKSTGRMLIAESVAIGIVGTFAGLATGSLMVGAIPTVVGMIWGNVTVAVPLLKITAMCAAGITAMLICSIIPFIKSKNITIMDNIRYE